MELFLPATIRETRSPQLLKAACEHPGLLGFCRRGSIEERAVPGPDDGVQHWNRHRCGGPDENNGWSYDGNRRRGMHHHADRAMIRICSRGMDVSHLDKGYKRQKHQTDQRRCAHGPGAAFARSLLEVTIDDFH